MIRTVFPICCGLLVLFICTAWAGFILVPVGNSYPFAIATGRIPNTDFKHKYQKNAMCTIYNPPLVYVISLVIFFGAVPR